MGINCKIHPLNYLHYFDICGDSIYFEDECVSSFPRVSFSSFRACVRARAHVTSLMGLAPPDWGGESLPQATEGEEED